MNASVRNYIQKVRQLDPNLADVLIELSKELDRVAKIVDPVPFTPKKLSIAKAPAPGSVVNFAYSFTDTNVILTWEAPSSDILLYEIRQGATWETATRLLITATLTAILDPIAVGTTTYLIKALNGDSYSIDAVSLDVVVPAIGNFTLTPSTIGNFIAIDWDAPESTFRIAYYRIRKDGSVVVPRNADTFWSRQEANGGSHTYGVTAYDLYGNASAEILATVEVSAPSDYEYEDSRTSGFTGTITNGYVDNNSLYVCIDNATSYEDHFNNNSWASPQAQVTAGYPKWLSPFETTASYLETFDFGAIFSNVIVNTSWMTELLSGTFTEGISVTVSDDNITYSSAYTSAAFFVTSVRYVRVTLSFTASADTALLRLFSFIVSLAVKRENDGGEAEVFAADTGGTVVEFNKAFKFIESITVTPLDTVYRSVTYDFAGGVDPTEFSVLLWNSAGSRVDGTISWKARGVM